jgi:DNA-directed RNA polymerase subunit beta
MQIKKTLPKKYFSKYREPFIEFPGLLEPQLASYAWLIERGIGEVFKEFSPIDDYSGKKFTLNWKSFSLSEPKCDEEHAKENKVSYEATLKARVSLFNKLNGQTKEQEIFLTDVPLMTGHGTFIINGVERVLVPQLARSFGVFFTEREQKAKKYFGAKVIPARGVWIEIDTEADGIVYVRIDKKRKFPITSLLRVLGLSPEEMVKACKTPELKAQMEFMIEKDSRSKG